MGALNCQKCINQETKIINELLLDGKEHRSRKVITSLEKQDTNSTPQKISTNFSEEKFNRINDSLYFGSSHKKLSNNKKLFYFYLPTQELPDSTNL